MSGGFSAPIETVNSNDGGFNDGNLHIVVMARSGSHIALYVDNVLQGETSTANADARDNSSMAIGRTNSGDVGFDGLIPEVRIYNGQLNSEEVAQVHHEIFSTYNNQAPFANDDTYELAEDPTFFETVFPVNVGVLANDTDAESDPLVAELVEDVKHGELALAPDGAFIYTPSKDFFGIDTFTYTANDFRKSAPATVTLTITPSYDAATAVADSYKSLAGEILNVTTDQGLLANDLNPDRADLKTIVSRNVNAGNLTLNQDGSFQYDPQGFAGPSDFCISDR